jgi:hypothetical protein
MSTAYAPKSHEGLNSGDWLGYELEEYKRKNIEAQVHAREPIS